MMKGYPMKRDYTTRKAWQEKLREIQAAYPGHTLKQIWMLAYNTTGGLKGAATLLGITTQRFSRQADAMGLFIVPHMVDGDSLRYQPTEAGHQAVRAMHDGDKVGV
jgi:hypothetical protein